MSIGMNLSAVTYYGSEYPFIDRFKTASTWFIHDASGYHDPDPSLIDSNGWPISEPAGAQFVANIPLDPISTTHTNRYVVTYQGTGDFTFANASIVSRGDHQLVIEANADSILLQFNMSNSDPVKNVHVVRQDQVDLYNSGEIFNPAFLSKMDPWGDLRFMDWNQTNGSSITSWSQRETLNSATWTNVPIEVEVALANKVHSDMWVNVPFSADDDYIRQLTTYVRDNLAPGLKLHLEYSNEVWNTYFPQSAQAQAKAEEMWGNGGHLDWTAREIYYGYRAAQMMSIAQNVFGSQSDSRLVGELGAFVGNIGTAEVALTGIAYANVGTVNSLFKNVAVTTYFGDQLSAGDAHDHAMLLDWARTGATGLTSAFQELNHGGLMDGNLSLDVLSTIWATDGRWAQAHGLNMVAYEGGLSSYWYGFSGSEQTEVMDFINRLLADPRMGDLYTRMIQLFQAAGGTEVNAYSDVGGVSVFGPWGALNSIYDDGSPRWNALVAAAGGTTTTIAPVAVLDPTHTALPTAQMADGLGNLTYTGTSAFTATGNALANTITGGDYGNHLYGMDGNDTLIGGAGADYLDGGTGADRMIGGAGDDVYIVDDAGDVVVENPGEGTDEVRTSLATYTLGANVENLTFTGPGAVTGTGNELANVLRAGDGGSHLYGGAGDDTLYGGAGADWLDGGTGADTMTGGAGDDTYIVDNAGDVVVELPGGGTDTVRTSLLSYTLGANVENLTYTGTGNAGFTGTGNELDNVIVGSTTAANHLYGGAGNDTLYGGAGNDYLDGGTGIDTMVGGAGNDVYIVRDTGDVVIEQPNGGLDEVRSYANVYALSANVENLTFVGTGDFTGTGNGSNNVITGGSGNDHLYGGDGADTLLGGAGDDWLDGGTGADMMVGGVGNDTYIVDNAGDRVFESPNEGYDTIYSSVSYTLPANVERLILTGTANLNATGNAAANALVGNAGNNVLDGGAGNDTLTGGGGVDLLTGGSGADTFVFKPGDLLAPGQATDRITDFSHVEGDRIDFTALRLAPGSVTPTPGQAAVSALSFIGSNGFGHHAGEVREVANGSNWDIAVDLDGDGVADIHLTVTSRTGALVAGDFML